MRVGSGFRSLQWAKQHDFLLLPGASDIFSILLCINCWCVHTVNMVCCALLHCVHYFHWLKTYITQHPTLCFIKLAVAFQFACGLKCQWSYSWRIYGQQLDLWQYGEYRHRPSTLSQLCRLFHHSGEMGQMADLSVFGLRPVAEHYEQVNESVLWLVHMTFRTIGMISTATTYVTITTTILTCRWISILWWSC